MDILLFICLTALFGVVSAVWTDLDLESFESITGATSRPVYCDLKAKRIGKGVYGVFGTITFNDDCSKYTSEVAILYSAKGNGEWSQTPIKLASTPLCDKFNHEYRKFVMKPLALASDMPDEDTDDLCEKFGQKTYTVNGYEIKGKSMPKFLQAGHYKVVILVRDPANTNEVTSEMHIVFKLS